MGIIRLIETVLSFNSINVGKIFIIMDELKPILKISNKQFHDQI